jgi:hypothetical protein
MHGGYDPDDKPKDKVDTASIREKVKLSQGEKWRILKNIGVVSFAFMVQFTAFQVSKNSIENDENFNQNLKFNQGTANLQSSINAKDSLGTISLSAIYGALVVSCIFLPTLIIRRLTVKWALFFSMMCYLPYIASQFYPRFYTLVPVSN